VLGRLIRRVGAFGVLNFRRVSMKTRSLGCNCERLGKYKKIPLSLGMNGCNNGSTRPASMAAFASSDKTKASPRPWHAKATAYSTDLTG
jgi:hypothetical protein